MAYEGELSRIYEKAMNFTACALIIAEIGFTIAYSALSAASIEHLIPLAVLIADLATISYISENSKGGKAQ